MKIQQFLEHHGIESNPFAEEDAQTDPVFNEHCIDSTYHPAWDKIYGNPAQPSTSIVFGEKGAGKTALRLQIARQLDDYNHGNPDARVYVIAYDDLNPFLDRFAERFSSRQRESGKALRHWKLWDHMDAILSLGVTSLADHALKVRHPSGPAANAASEDKFRQLDRHQVRDLLLLAAAYDQSTSETFRGRWQRLCRKLHYPSWMGLWDRAVGILGVLAVLLVIIISGNWSWFGSIWPYLFAAAAWIPWLIRMAKWHFKARSIVKNVRVGNRETNALRAVLMRFRRGDLSGQPLPSKSRTDDRYELLMKLQGILKTLGFSGIVVLVDRVDEPYLVNGSNEQMRSIIWPMLDNKFLKQPGIGLKLLLPIELSTYIEREERDFYQRARLDKQNMVPSLEWTGEALYDVASARLKACATPRASPTIRGLFDESISDQRLLEAFRSLRVPRHLFKFFYRLLVAHSNAYTDEDPSWKISGQMFEATLAVFQREQEAFDRGVRTG